MKMLDQYPYRDKDYKAFIREQPCCITGITDSEVENVVPHHVEARGMSTKCSDYKTVPLCQSIHLELHQIGRKKFADKYSYVDFRNVMIQYLSKYIRTITMVDSYE